MLSNVILGFVLLFLSAVIVGVATVIYFLFRGDTISISSTCPTKNESIKTDKKKLERP